MTFGTPGRTRTCYPRLRRPMLYPNELRAHKLVGVERFELPTSCSQSRRATRLRYTPQTRLKDRDGIIPAERCKVNNSINNFLKRAFEPGKRFKSLNQLGMRRYVISSSLKSTPAAWAAICCLKKVWSA